jgi:hypothetical protein
MINIDAIRADHSRSTSPGRPEGVCFLCKQVWPCDAAQLADLLTPERIAEALHRVRSWEWVQLSDEAQARLLIADILTAPKGERR